MDARITIPRCRRHAPRCRVGGILLSVAIAMAGCGSDEDTPTSPGGGGGGSGSTSFAGTMLGASVTGTFAISIQTTSLSAPNPQRGAASAVIPLNGTMTFSTGGPVAITGNFETPDDSLHFFATDSLGGVYEFHGKLNRSSTLTPVFGNWTGPALETGAWGAYQGTPGSVTAYCGNFTGSRAGIVTFLTREVVISGDVNGRVVGVLWLTNSGVPVGAYPFKGWVVEYVPPAPPMRTLEIDGTDPGVYEIYFGGEVNSQTGAFSASGGVDDLQNPQNVIYGDISGGLCP